MNLFLGYEAFVFFCGFFCFCFFLWGVSLNWTGLRSHFYAF